MDLNLFNKNALITGSSKGIGLDIAKRFLDGGGKVIIWDIAAKLIEKVLKDINNNDFIKYSEYLKRLNEFLLLEGYCSDFEIKNNDTKNLFIPKRIESNK